MVSTPSPPDTLASLQLNTFADGCFHALTWLVTVVGVALLFVAARPNEGAARRLVGGMLIGWGSFNVVEGIINHHLLNLYHVRPGPDRVLYDLGFLAWGAAMLVVGYVLTRPWAGYVPNAGPPPISS